MITYFILLLFLLFFARIYDKSKSYYPIVICFIALTLVAGLRDVEVGTDSWSYYFQFEDDEIWKNLNFRTDLTHEGTFNALVALAQKLSTNYAALFILVAVIVYGASLYALTKISSSLLISMFVYVTLGIAVFCYNGERQGIAIAIYLLSIPYLLKKNFIRYCVIVLLAALFHRTIIVAIPLYFLFTLKYNFKTVCLIIIASAFLVYLLPTLLIFATRIDSKYQGYMGKSVSGGESLMLAYVAMTVYFIYTRKFIEQRIRDAYDTFLLMFISGTIIYMVVILNGYYIEISRFACYFHTSALFIWPMILKSKTLKKYNLITLAFVVGHLAFMYIYYSRMSRLVPYIFNTTL